jgi:hypothetical protein
MNREDMLTALIAQAQGNGCNLVTLRAIVEEASELGANRVLRRLGLEDAKAQDDIDELRELLGAWRAAKASATKAVLDWVLRGAMALVLIGIAFRIGAPELLR